MRACSYLIAAVAGLACGFAVRWQITRPATAAGFVRNAGVADRRPLVIKPSPAAPTGKWESRIAHYLTSPIPSESLGKSGPRAETAALLRMALRPVSADSIRESVAVLNAMGTSRYSPIMAAIFGRWAREAPEAALAAAGGLRDPGAKMALVWKVFENAASAGDSDLLVPRYW